MQQPQYNVGDLIIYGSTGVCRVADISKENPPLYTLQPLYQDCVIYTPLSGKVFARPIISSTEAKRLIDLIPSIDAQPFRNRSMRELVDHYQHLLDTHECEDLIRLTMSIYAKRKELEAENRKFGAVDQRYLKQAEQLLFGELGAALDLKKDDIPSHINTCLDGLGKDFLS